MEATRPLLTCSQLCNKHSCSALRLPSQTDAFALSVDPSKGELTPTCSGAFHFEGAHEGVDAGFVSLWPVCFPKVVGAVRTKPPHPNLSGDLMFEAAGLGSATLSRADSPETPPAARMRCQARSDKRGQGGEGGGGHLGVFPFSLGTWHFVSLSLVTFHFEKVTPRAPPTIRVCTVCQNDSFAFQLPLTLTTFEGRAHLG